MSVAEFDRQQIPVESIIMKANDSDEDLLGILKKDDSFGKDLDLDVIAVDRPSLMQNDLGF